MSNEVSQKLKSSTSKYEGIVNVFSYLVKERVYGPVDRLARAVDQDMVRLALYEALRYVSTEQRKGAGVSLPSESEVQEFLESVEKQGVGVAKKVAIKSLARGLGQQSTVEKQEQRAQ
ncbi:MAG: hypothetical protein QW579_01635 [Desulfurococcaceae archaeon]